MGDAQAAVFNVPAELYEQMKAALPPEVVAPAMSYLAHESCPLNGELLFVTPGRVARLAMVLSRGLAKDTISAEDIAEHIDEIVDLTEPFVVGLDRIP
jgi:hypothetical protein